MIDLILKNGDKLYYDPATFDVSESKFNEDIINDEEVYEIKTKSPKTIKILFGDACNFRCKYCRQDEHKKKEHISKERLDNFISLLKNNLDLNQLIKVEFWGGEPLLYWEELQYLKKNFFDHINSNMIYHLTTNGSLITNEIVNEFISGPNYMIKLSHDGPGQFLRTQDPLVLHPDEIKLLHRELSPRNLFFINTVLTWECLSPGKIVNYFREKIDPFIKIMKIEPSIPYNEHASKYTLRDCDFKEYEETFYHDLMMEDLLGSVNEYQELFNFFMYSINQPRISKTKPVYNFSEAKCHEVQKVTLSLDLDGNIMPCQVYDKDSMCLGNIRELDKSIYTLPLIVNRKRMCRNCPVLSLCRGVCPYMQDLQAIDKNCKVRFHTYFTLLKYFMKFVMMLDLDHFEGDFRHVKSQIY